ncbi:S46 family peptidase [Geothrix edaphica]|uniref:Dipeptidyl-peptidase n=1 Tax=Geothrix edaphica TaxID=2927976 RepID=A0ABQ5PUM4_9BACT|nr:S46 family peptidase [Geothrix edaphica]GLH66160.1 dipeptidyl-peptidase [Geothrix edaphica]
MRLSALALSLVTVLALPALRADEGMWTFDNIPVKQIKAKYGVDLDTAWLKNLQLATVRFPGGTGAFVSRDGLVVTNHHVGRGAIAQVSSAQADLVKNGFTAARRSQEIKVPGLELMMLVSMKDVTARVIGAVKPGLSDQEAMAARLNALADLRRTEEAKTGLTCEPVTLYQGGEYWLYRYRKFSDVRLVAAPELQVAAFGGDPDNYTYPRHNLDFSLFRVYEDGKPYQPEAILPFSAKGVAMGELTFISGHPFSTFRQQTHAQMAYARDFGIPFQLRTLERQKQALQALSATSPESRRLAAEAIYGIENGHKRLSGQLLGLAKAENLKKVETAEAALKAAVAKDPALQARVGESWNRVAEAVERQKALLKEATYIDSGRGTLVGRVASLRHALTLVRLADETARPSAERLTEFSEGNLKATRAQLLSPRPVQKPIDTALLAAGLQEAKDELGADHPFVKALLGDQSPEAVAKAAVEGTKLDDPAVRKQLAEGGKAALEASTDPMILLAKKIDPFGRAVHKRVEAEVTGVFNEHGGRIAEARFKAFGRAVYPDATFTLRLGYGPVATYANGTGTLAQPFTTFMGMYDRHLGWGGNAAAAEHGAWTLPERWLKRQAKLDLATPFNFIYACDTVGGNSGSPVVNVQGEFVGINFDSVFEGQGGYYVYDADTKRAVATDARAILEALRKVMDARHLVAELTGK